MKNILEYLEHNATAFPDRKAVADIRHAYSYRELKETALGICAQIKRENDGTGLIGVSTGRDALTVAMFLGVLYAGAAYVPLDPSLPGQKLKAIIADTGMSLILGREGEQSIAGFSGTGFIAADQIPADAPDGSVTMPELAEPAGDDQLLYLVYTSGSTGEPKGVVKTHGAYISFIEAYIKTFEFDDSLVIGNQSPFHFDASAKDIYLALATGGTLEIIPSELFMFGPKLIDHLNERGVNFISWVPSALTVVAKLKTFDKVRPKYLNNVFFVGEACRTKTLRAWTSAVPGARFVNLYGASEQSGIACWYEVRDLQEDDELPIGKPLCNSTVTLRETSGRKTAADTGPLPPEIAVPHKTGEIYIQSPALATGYWHDPVKTAAAFINTGDGVHLKTGDLARYDESGNLVFASRSDSQIKHMGHRIELGEIETVASSLPEIDQCCCLYNESRERIVLFAAPVSMPENEKEFARSVLGSLREKLAPYMMPWNVIIRETLPLNANGKIDRMALKKDF